MADVLRLEQLSLRGFRNLRDVEWTPGPRFNVLHGDNGQGKSNLLEAIDYVGRLKSFRGARNEELIGKDQDQADLVAVLSAEPLPRTHRIRLRRQAGRLVSVDGKRPRSHSAYHLGQQLVLFHPGDMQLSAGAPDQRRAFLDHILVQFDGGYGAALGAYERALRSRNRLLKADRPDRRAITAYDTILAREGAVLGQARSQLLATLAPQVEELFAEISGQGLPLSMRYQPRVTPEADMIVQALAAAWPKDIARGFTADGPHGDDVGFFLAGAPARRFASQGQHRALVLALKIAELQELARRVGRVPILLLDDVSSELDRSRNRLLFTLLSRLGGQVFLTTTHPEFILLHENRADFAIANGQLS